MLCSINATFEVRCLEVHDLIAGVGQSEGARPRYFRTAATLR
jgi:hypothetical protein